MAPREVSEEEIVRAQTRVWNYSLGSARPLSVMVAVQLGIPGAVRRHGGPISLPDLASAVGVPEARVPALRRLMRALACFGVFDRDVKGAGGEGGGQTAAEAYLPTLCSRLLEEDSPTGGPALLDHMLYPPMLTAWYSVAAWIRGEAREMTTPFEAAHGETLLQSYDRDMVFNDKVVKFMGRDSRWVVGLMAREHPEVFRDLTSLVDVGGSHGSSSKAIKDAFPKMKCSVLDLPDTVAAMPPIEGVDFVAGDMFKHIPPADGILLKWVLLNYEDDDCARILRLCKEAIPAREQGGKVIIIEIVMGTGGALDHELTEAQHLFDLACLVCWPEGRERDEAEWRRIFAAAGFSDCKITPVLGPRSIIEVFP